MLRGNELFYGRDLVPEHLQCGTSAQQFIQDPKIYVVPDVPKAKEENKPAADKNKPVVLRASVCCGECVELIEHDIKKVKGVKDVDCETFRQRVTVTGTALSAVDVLSAAKRHFKDAKMWE